MAAVRARHPASPSRNVDTGRRAAGSRRGAAAREANSAAPRRAHAMASRSMAAEARPNIARFASSALASPWTSRWIVASL